MARVYLVLAVLAVFFWVFSIVDCAVLPEGRHRGVSKVSWILIVVLIPVLGGILWFSVGRVGPNAVPVSGPDDDPGFRPRIDRDEQDRRIRELEAQLAALDEEDAQRRDEQDEDDDAEPRP